MSGMNTSLKSLTPVHIGSSGPSLPALVLQPTAEPKTKSNRCGCCTKKLLLSDIGCSKCDRRYCSAHRLPELHTCPHDFKKEGQALLAKQNPRVVGDKLDRC